jgi:hypothetical protein
VLQQFEACTKTASAGYRSLASGLVQEVKEFAG